MKNIFCLKVFNSYFLYGSSDTSLNSSALPAKKVKNINVKEKQFPVELIKNKSLKIMQVEELHFLKYFFSKKKKFWQKKVDYFFTESKLINFAIKNQEPNLMGVWIFDTLKSGLINKEPILIIGNEQKNENKIRHQFEIFYGNSKSLFFLSRQLLVHSRDKIKIFIEKSQPKIVLLDKFMTKKNYSIIANLEAPLVLINLDIDNLYLKKKINYIIYVLKYLLFFPFYFSYFLVIKLNYNKT